MVGTKQTMTNDLTPDVSIPAARHILVNDPKRLVAELIDGYLNVWSEFVSLNSDGLIVRSTEKPRGRVGLAIGNGLGHEPAMMGLVGPGLFDVNIPDRK